MYPCSPVSQASAKVAFVVWSFHITMFYKRLGQQRESVALGWAVGTPGFVCCLPHCLTLWPWQSPEDSLWPPTFSIHKMWITLGLIPFGLFSYGYCHLLFVLLKMCFEKSSNPGDICEKKWNKYIKKLVVNSHLWRSVKDTKTPTQPCLAVPGSHPPPASGAEDEPQEWSCTGYLDQTQMSAL